MGTDTLDVEPPHDVPERTPEYCYPAKVRDIVDGDTVDVVIDLGFETEITKRIRLRDIDTREISFVEEESEEYKRGMEHKGFVEYWCTETRKDGGNWPFVLYSKEYNRGTYGRIIGDLYSPVHEEWLTRELYNNFDDVEVYD